MWTHLGHNTSVFILLFRRSCKIRDIPTKTSCQALFDHHTFYLHSQRNGKTLKHIFQVINNDVFMFWKFFCAINDIRFQSLGQIWFMTPSFWGVVKSVNDVLVELELDLLWFYRMDFCIWKQTEGKYGLITCKIRK